MDYTMDMLVDKNIVPFYAAKEMLWDCEVCGKPVVYNEALTSVKCTNTSCKGQMAAYAAAIASDLDYKGLGYASLLKIFQTYDLKSYFDVFSKDFLDKRYLGENHTVDLLKTYTQTPVSKPFYTLFTYLFVPGLQSEWSDIVATSKSIEDVNIDRLPARYGFSTRFLIKKKLSELYKIMYLIDPIYRYSTTTLEVMITGHITDFANKNDFIAHLNSKYGRLYSFKQVGKKKSSHLCICDSTDSMGKPFSTTPKYRIAKECGIPILTSKELLFSLQKQKEAIDHATM